jgi:hypothetical protein
MDASLSALEIVQQLYLLQAELLHLLESGIRSPKAREAAKRTLREFNKLLKEADPRYMGGEDVVAGLEDVKVCVAKKLQR